MAKANLRIISFAGVKHADIPYYMAKLLAIGRRNVLIVDNSEQHDLYQSIYKKHEMDIVNVGNITYIKDIAWSPESFEKFEVVIIYHGEEIDRDIWENSTNRFLLMNTDRFDMERVRAGIPEGSAPFVILMVDVYYGKIKAKDIPAFLNISDSMVNGIESLPFDEKDAAALEAFQFNGIQRVRDTSDSMKEFLLDIYKHLGGSDMKMRNFKEFIAAAN